MKIDRIARAKEFLAIAESKDSKREAYIKAAEEIAAHKTDSGESNERIAIRLDKSESTIDKILQWRKSGYEAETPFLMDEGATTRAARSHAKTVLKNSEQRTKVLDELPEEDQVEVAREILAKPKVQKAFAENRKASAELTEASGKVFERVERRERARHREAFPQSGNTTEMLTITTRLNNATSAIVKSHRELQDLVLTSHEEEIIGEAAERARTAAEILVRSLSGDTFDDDALAELLREEEEV
jgi:transposase